MALHRSWCLPVVVVFTMTICSVHSAFTIPDCRPRSSHHSKTVFRIAVTIPELLGSGERSWLYARERVSPAIEIALETVRAMSLLSGGVELAVNYSNDKDDIGEAMNIAIKYFTAGEADVFFGPLNDYSLAPIARQTRFWNLPLLTPGGMVNDFMTHRAKLYPMLTRVGTDFGALTRFIIGMLKHFGFEKVKLIYNPEGHRDVVPNFCHLAMDSIHNIFNSKNVSFPHEYYKFTDISHFREFNMTKEIGLEYAVVVLCASPDSVREIMITAAENGFTNGEYVFLNIDLFSSKELLERPWYRRNDPQRNDVARAAFESTMTVTLRSPENERYARFSEEVKRRATAEYGNRTYRPDEQVNSFVAAFHDAVVLYALALNETIANHEDPRNGSAITRRMWNRRFEGITGNVTMDENGDRNADYSLLDLNPSSQTFEVVANYYGSERQYQFADAKIHWPGGRTKAPPDTPVCGFDNSKCKTGLPPYAYVIIALVVLLLIVILMAGIFIWRERVRRKTMSEKYWRVNLSEINTGQLTKARRTSIVSIMGVPHDDPGSETGTLAGGIAGQSFIPTGIYKGEVVAIKKVNRSLARQTTKMNTLKEIKRLRDLTNDHVVRFIGVCIDEGHESIVTLYCQKGSLEDVLENEEVSLDKLFKLSLIQDIIRGMHCIHNSEIRFHGNLKTSNCVLDSRFVVKLTDFGLHFIRCQESVEDVKAYSQWKSKLWMAPEQLRDQTISSPEMKQKGDVYAFAIICQEILYRKGTFWVEDSDVIEPQTICERVKASEAPLFRPTMTEHLDKDFYEEDILKMVKSCWADDPVERPDFSRIKSICNKLYKQLGGDKGNIMDSLLNRMEVYATNLEDLVREKTAGYLEQKKLAEDLLYAILPRSVAEQLMAKKAVKAEEYDSVTIYFSDICGFTDLSGRSTPMQVVKLLNKLYRTFDEIIDSLDVYKVETIGDAYMVVSGLPKRNGNCHAREICRMALMLLNAIKTFTIPHFPNEKLNLRIGIHSGYVCAGVVGVKMPRYCLFGDTVNTASRMESNGAPLMIHVSPHTKEILDVTGNFVTKLRGPVEMKGKGVIVTWWLLGELNPDHPELTPSDMNLSEQYVRESVC